MALGANCGSWSRKEALAELSLREALTKFGACSLMHEECIRLQRPSPQGALPEGGAGGLSRVLGFPARDLSIDRAERGRSFL